jgi:hypothetical protein
MPPRFDQVLRDGQNGCAWYSKVIKRDMWMNQEADGAHEQD